MDLSQYLITGSVGAASVAGITIIVVNNLLQRFIKKVEFILDDYPKMRQEVTNNTQSISELRHNHDELIRMSERIRNLSNEIKVMEKYLILAVNSKVPMNVQTNSSDD